MCLHTFQVMTQAKKNDHLKTVTGCYCFVKILYYLICSSGIKPSAACLEAGVVSGSEDNKHQVFAVQYTVRAVVLALEASACVF